MRVTSRPAATCHWWRLPTARRTARWARWGVIGPTRMNYQRVIPLVQFTAQVLSSVLGGLGESPGRGPSEARARSLAPAGPLRHHPGDGVRHVSHWSRPGAWTKRGDPDQQDRPAELAPVHRGSGEHPGAHGSGPRARPLAPGQHQSSLLHPVPLLGFGTLGAVILVQDRILPGTRWWTSAPPSAGGFRDLPPFLAWGRPFPLPCRLPPTGAPVLGPMALWNVLQHGLPSLDAHLR